MLSPSILTPPTHTHIPTNTHFISSTTGGLSSLSIRVMEYWEYDIGGGLIDPFHYDVDSVLTLVALLSGHSHNRWIYPPSIPSYIQPHILSITPYSILVLTLTLCCLRYFALTHTHILLSQIPPIAKVEYFVLTKQMVPCWSIQWHRCMIH